MEYDDFDILEYADDFTGGQFTGEEWGECNE